MKFKGTLIFILGSLSIFFSFVQLEKQFFDHGYVGTLESYQGALQILDPTQKKILHFKPKISLPHGCWIFLEHGWAKIKFSDQSEIYLGEKTLIQFPGILYRGKILARIFCSKGWQMISSSAKIQAQKANLLIVVREQNEKKETQLAVLKGNGIIENRFQSQQRLKLKAGQSSVLSLQSKNSFLSLPQKISSLPLPFISKQFGLSRGDFMKFVDFDKSDKIFLSSFAQGGNQEIEDFDIDSYFQNSGNELDASLKMLWRKKTLCEDEMTAELIQAKKDSIYFEIKESNIPMTKEILDIKNQLTELDT